MTRTKAPMIYALILTLLFAVSAISTAPARAADSANALPQLTGIMPGPKAVGTITQYMLWKNTSGQYSLWDMDVAGNYNYFLYGPNSNWTVTDFKAGYDGLARMLWTNTSGLQSLYTVASDGTFTYNLLGPYTNWTIHDFAPGPDAHDQLLWQNTSGQASLWNYNPSAGTYTYFAYGPITNWAANGVSVGANNDPMLLWQRSDNLTAVWTVNPSNGTYTDYGYGPYTSQGWYSKFVATGGDNITRLAWANTNGEVSLWAIGTNGDYTYYTYTLPTTWHLTGLSVDKNFHPHLFFVSTTNAALLYNINPSNGDYTSLQYGPYANYTPVFYSAIPLY